MDCQNAGHGVPSGHCAGSTSGSCGCQKHCHPISVGRQNRAHYIVTLSVNPYGSRGAAALGIVALALLFPVLVFISTATRLAAARREQRFAAMRLAGATPRQVSLVAAVEAATAAITGTAAGFGLFFLFRIDLAKIPFTGQPSFPADMSLSPVTAVVVALGIPAAAAVVAHLALRRVRISPLGTAQRTRAPRPGAWRAIPLLAGIGA